MFRDTFWLTIYDHIAETIDDRFNGSVDKGIIGGCINHVKRVRDLRTGRPFFVKLNHAGLIKMFETEADGLNAINNTGTIRVPKPLCHGIAESQAYLVLEWLDLAPGTPENQAELGRQLARMHQIDVGSMFGWHRDNYIGASPQNNQHKADWTDFFTDERLEYQVRMADRKGTRFPLFLKLRERIPELLADYKVRPSLVHGDLWSGNAAFVEDGQPVIFDVACYHGDREVDIAMSRLFGGFPEEFYAGYQEVFPLEEGFEKRQVLYNLYHILNHFNLFDGPYEFQANRMMEQLLA